MVNNEVNSLVIIDSVYINQSGGKVLLETFISKLLKKNEIEYFFFLFDIRIKLNENIDLNRLNFLILNNSEKSRKQFYDKNRNRIKSIFCFANVPPPIKFHDKSVFIYFHNTLLLDNKFSNLSKINVFMILLKRIYIKFKIVDNYNWIVQSPLICDSLSEKFQVKKSNIEILPIFNIANFINCNLNKKEFDNHYLYVADSSEQKNHNILLDAWELFANKIDKSRVFLHLTLSVNSSQKLLERIDLMRFNGYNIMNHGFCNYDKIISLYSKCNFLIYPSLAESFGLPLVEAAAAGCKVLSSHLPFVFQVIEPSLTFNPNDSTSIADVLLITQQNIPIKSSILRVESKIDELIKKITS